MRCNLPPGRACPGGRSLFPQGAEIEVELLTRGRADADLRGPVLVDPPVDVLEIGQVSGEQVLDDVRRPLLEVAEPSCKLNFL